MTNDLIGHVCYDSDAKEYVKVTNDKCTLDHSSLDAFKASHGKNGMGSCVFAPSGAIALRCFPQEDGTVHVAFTYRSVRSEALTRAKYADHVFVNFQNMRTRAEKGSSLNVGRI
jgi:hypothetical protein